MTEADWVKIACAVFSLLGGLVLFTVKRMAINFDRLVDSIEKLNVNVAIVVEKTNSHDRRITRLEEGRDR